MSARRVPPSRPVAAAIAIVVRDDRILLVRRANPPDAGRWGFPGGRIEIGETVQVCAIREFREEAGITGHAVRVLTAEDAFDHGPDGALRHHVVLIAVGLCLQAGYFAFTYLSLRYGLTAGAVALITSQQLVLMGLLAPAIVGERVTGTRWLGLILGVGGAVIVIASNSHLNAASGLGLAFGCLALLSMACSTLIEKRFSIPTHPVAANLVRYAVGLAVVAPLALWIEPLRVDWSWPLTGSLAYLVFGNSLLAISLLLAMIRHGEASRVSALFFLAPPTTAVIAFLVLGEALSVVALPGMLLAILGIHLVMRERS